MIVASGIISTNNLLNIVPAMLDASGNVTSNRSADMSILTHKQCGVYEIYNTVNGHRYIGSALYVGRRWKLHLQQLRTNTHHSIYLQRAFNRYGESAFVFRVLEECKGSDLIGVEQRYIDRLNPEYNISRVAGSPLGVKHTAETKAKVGAASRGNKHALGYKHTDEWKKQNAERMKGNKHSLGFKQSEETKKKKSESCKGKHLGSKPWLGRTHTEETKEKIRQANKGKPKTEEHKRKLRVGRQRFLDSLKELMDE